MDRFSHNGQPISQIDMNNSYSSSIPCDQNAYNPFTTQQRSYSPSPKAPTSEPSFQPPPNPNSNLHYYQNLRQQIETNFR